jgi:hypothetical protein
MKNIFLKKLLIAFSVVPFLVYGTFYACSDGDWGWSFDSNFTPETFVDKSYSPLFLSADFFYNYSDNEHNTRFNQEMVSDWSVYLKEGASKELIRFFLVDSSAKDVAKLYSFYKTKKNNATTIKWSKKIKLQDYKVKQFVEFLHYSQQIEIASVNNYDHWGYEEVKTNTFKDLKWIKSIENKYNTATDPFMKNRYWFQVIKAYFYSSSKQSAISFFQKTVQSVPKNTLYYRAVAYIAGVENKQKKYAHSNYLYSQVFDKCPSLRIVAAYSFHPKEQKDWNQSLAMAKNNDETAALWAIQGYYGDEEKAIASIFKAKPQSEHLDYLLTRLINNQERKINNSFEKKTVQDNKKSTKDSISKSAIQMVAGIAQSEKTAKPYLWNLAAGYLETLNQNFVLADSYFDKAESKMPKTLLAVNQLRLLRFVNNLSKIDLLTPVSEKTILKDLTWLYQELPKASIENFRYENASKWSKSYIAALYSAKKNNVMAELFVRNPNFYDNSADLQAMKSFLSKSNKTGLESLGMQIYNVSLGDINDYQAVNATFENKIPEAITFMQQSDSLQFIVFYGNPFNGNIKDCHDCEHAAPQKKKYSQLEFLTIIKTMQDNVAVNKEVFTNSLLLGNAFYNITHFGNARLFYEGNIIGSSSSPYYFKEPIKNMITNCTLAKAYYTQALVAASTPEQKAKCYYLLAKCERNEYYNNLYDASKNSWENDWAAQESKINFLGWNSFKILKKEYAQTNYFKEVLAECGYFKTFVEK